MHLTLSHFIHTHCPTNLKPLLLKIEMSPIGYRLAKGAFWVLSGTVISRLCTFIASIFVARLLGKTGFGEFGIIQSTIGMFGVFAGFGLGLTSTKYIAEFRETDPARAGRILSLSWLVALVTGGLMSIGLFLFSPWLATHTLNASHLESLIRIGAIVLFVSALNGAQTGALSGFEAFRSVAKVNLYCGLLSFPILVTCTWLGGVKGAIYGMAINTTVNWLLNHIEIRKIIKVKKIPITLCNCGKEVSVLWKFSLPALFAGAMVGPVNWFCNTLLVNQPNGYAEMGVYNAANQWYTMMLFLPGILGQVVLPILSNREQLNNSAGRSIKTMANLIKMNALLVFPLVIVTCLFSPFIMGLYGEGFRNGWPTLVIILFTSAIVTIQTPVGQLIAVSGKMWIGFIMNAGWGIMFILLAFVFISKGSFGLAGSRLIGYILHTIWVFSYAFYIFRNQPK